MEIVLLRVFERVPPFGLGSDNNNNGTSSATSELYATYKYRYAGNRIGDVTDLSNLDRPHHVGFGPGPLGLRRSFRFCLDESASRRGLSTALNPVSRTLRDPTRPFASLLENI